MHPSVKDIPAMSAAELDVAVSQWTRLLEDRRAKRLGVPIGLARQSIARDTGVAPGTLENLRRQRIKGVKAWVRDRIVAAMIRETEFEIQRHTHELEVLRQMGADARSSEVLEVQSNLAALTKLLPR